jgi:hypothetical protein
MLRVLCGRKSGYASVGMTKEGWYFQLKSVAGRANCRSPPLRFGRDDKGEGNGSSRVVAVPKRFSSSWVGPQAHPTLGMTKERARFYGEWLRTDKASRPSNGRYTGSGPPFREPSPFPLSSRAKPRDLQFYGPFVDTFSTERSVEISAVFSLLRNRSQQRRRGCTDDRDFGTIRHDFQ